MERRRKPRGTTSKIYKVDVGFKLQHKVYYTTRRNEDRQDKNRDGKKNGTI